jgi:hypothetical protein
MINLKGKGGDKEVLNDSSLVLTFEGYRESFSLSCLTKIMFEGSEAGPVQTLALQCSSKSEHWSVSAAVNRSTGLSMQESVLQHWTYSAISLTKVCLTM